MTPAEFLARLRRAFGQQEPADCDRYNVEHRREAREETTLNILKANWQEESHYRKSTLCWTRATFFVLLATLGAVAYYADVARQQRDIMEKGFEASERAWIALSGLKTEKGIFFVQLKNVGRAPAFYVRFRIAPSQTPTAPVIPLPLGGVGSQSTMAINGDQWLPIPASLFTKEVRDGRVALYLWIGVKYSDPASGDPNVKDRFTRECVFYIPAITPAISGLAICPSGQEHT